MKPRTVHKFAGDDPTATRTACGLKIRSIYTPTLLRLVDADVRKVTCGNCARSRKVTP